MLLVSEYLECVSETIFLFPCVILFCNKKLVWGFLDPIAAVNLCLAIATRWLAIGLALDFKSGN